MELVVYWRKVRECFIKKKEWGEAKEAKRNQTIANKDKSRMFLGRQSKYFPRQIKAKACNDTKKNCIKDISVPLNPIHLNNPLSPEYLQLI
ncbi:hypothetical protein HMPREF2738_01946, partial [Clostridiales bacterium KLE1615]